MRTWGAAHAIGERASGEVSARRREGV